MDRPFTGWQLFQPSTYTRTSPFQRDWSFFILRLVGLETGPADTVDSANLCLKDQVSKVIRVLLCGNSLFVDGLQASLEVIPGLDLQQVEPNAERISERVKAWKPEVLIFETRLLKSALPLSILQDFPQVRLISVDLDDNRLLVLSGSISVMPTTDELLQVITA